MTDKARLLERLRSADPMPAEHVDAEELSAFVSYFEERKAEMTTTKTPERTQVPSRPTRRFRAAAALGAAAVLVAAVGLVVWLGAGGEEALPDQGGSQTTVATPTTTLPADETPGTAAPVPTTTAGPTTTTTAPSRFAGLVDLDPEATSHQFGPTELAVTSDGRPQVLYGGGDITRLAVCEDSECSTASIIDLPDVTGWRTGAIRPTSGPVFLTGGSGDFAPEPRLVVCHDEACTRVTYPDVMPSAARAAFTVDGEGRVLVVYSGPDGPSLVVLWCADGSCSPETIRHVIWRPEAEWLGPLPGSAFDGDRLLIATRTGGPERTDHGILIAQCTTSACMSQPDGSGVEVLAHIPVSDAVRGPLLTVGPDGAPIALVELDKTSPDAETYTGALAVAACTDADCYDWVITELADVEDMYMEWAMATGPDGRVRIVWTELRTDSRTVFLATCEDGTCSRFTIADTGHPASDVALGFDAGGSPIIATSSRERGLELLFCGDDACRPGG